MTEFPSRKAFRAWLTAKPPTEVVAQDWCFTDCPIANHLRACGHQVISIDADEVICDGAFYEPPFWLSQFVDKVDDLNDDGYVVTAAECLAILDAIP